VDVHVSDNAELNRYEVFVDGTLAGFAQYRLRDGRITMFHTEVEPAYGGQGVGSRLVKVALDDVRDRGLKVVPTCPFVAAYARDHADEYPGLVAER